MGEDKEKKFKVVDKRRIGREDAPEEKKEIPIIEKEESGEAEEKTRTESHEGREDNEKEEAAKQMYGSSRKQEGYREPQFGDLVLSLHTGALATLGLIGEEGSEPGTPDIDSARQYIDLLEVLEKKTSGNLTGDEENLLKDALYQLRMVFVKISDQMANNP